MRVLVIFVVLCILTYGRGQKSSNDMKNAPFEIVDEPGGEVIIARLTDDNMVEVDDMLMTREQFEELFQPAARRLGKRVAIKGRRWPNGVIPYEFAADLEVSKTAIRITMNEWENQTCVRFIPKRPTDKAYLVIQASLNKCESYVGYFGGVTNMYLAKKCQTKHILLHELGHAIGLLHEQDHPDRDKSIKVATSHMDTYGIAYDPTSVMHYAIYGVKQLATKLSPKSDIPIVKKMYCNI